MKPQRAISRGSYSGRHGVIKVPNIDVAITINSPLARVTNSAQITNLNSPKGEANEPKKYMPIDHKLMSTIRVNLGKMKNAGNNFIQNNRSSVIKQTQLTANLDKLEDLFYPFLRDTINFFSSPNNFRENQDNTFITTPSLRSSAFSFIQQWKAVLSIFSTLKDQGIPSLQCYINDQFQTISNGLNKIQNHQEKHTNLFEIIKKSCDINRESMSNCSELINNLINNFTDPTGENVNFYIAEVRKFLSIFNESFYNVFPKSGLSPLELSGIKTETLNSANEIIFSLKGLFSFWNDYRELAKFQNEIQPMLETIACQMRLPLTYLKYSSNTRNQNKNQNAQFNEEKDLKPRAPNEFARVEAFISKTVKLLGKPPLDIDIDIWKRLKTIQKIIKETVDNLNESKIAYAQLKANTSTFQHMLLEVDANKRIIADQKQEIAKLKQLLEDSEQEIKHKNEKISMLENDCENKQEKKSIQQISMKLNKMMNNVDFGVEHLLVNNEKENHSNNQNEENAEQNNVENEVSTLEKLNIFVLEKRCSKCHEYEKQKKEMIKLLEPVLKIEKGESLLDSIKTLVTQHQNLEMENARITAASEDLHEQLNELKEAASMLLHNNQSRKLRKHPPPPTGSAQSISNDSSSILQSFRDIELNYQNEIQLFENQLNNSHAKKLDKILYSLNSLFPDDNDEDFFKNRRKQKIKKSKLIEGNIDDKCDAEEEEEEEFEDPQKLEDRIYELEERINRKIAKISQKFVFMQQQINQNSELMSKIKGWMVQQTDQVDISEMSFDEALPLLMKAIDSKESPLQTHIETLERESELNLNECRNFVNGMFSDFSNLKEKAREILTKDKSESAPDTSTDGSPSSRQKSSKGKKGKDKKSKKASHKNSSREDIRQEKDITNSQGDDNDGNKTSSNNNNDDDQNQYSQEAKSRKDWNDLLVPKEEQDSLLDIMGDEKADLSRMTFKELIQYAKDGTRKIRKRLLDSQLEVEEKILEIEGNKMSLDSIAERLHHLLQIENEVDFSKMDMNSVMFNISQYIDYLLQNGTKGLFISVSDLNEMSKEAKQYSKYPNSPDPTLYLPDIFERYSQSEKSLSSAKKFEEPLEIIFKNFDFQPSSFRPDQKSFLYLRDRIFQLHLLLGSEKASIPDEKLHNVFKHFISLLSSFLSFIATNQLSCINSSPTELSNAK